MNSVSMSAYRHLIDQLFVQENLSWPGQIPENFARDFIRQTRNDGVQLLIYDKVSQSPLWREWPEPVRTAFAAAAQNDAIVDTLRQQDFASLHAHFLKEGIQPVLLKGAALSLTHYSSSYLRPRGDTDFLIPQDTLSRVNKVMEQQGYRSETPTGREYGNYQISFSKKNAAGINAVYDVHWKLCNPELFASLMNYDEIKKEAGTVPLFGQTVKVISSAHALLHACIHLVAHHPNEQKLIWLYDMHLLAQNQTPVGLENFYRLAAEKKVRKVCAHGLRLAKDSFRTQIPEAFLKRLETAGGHEPSERFLTMTPSLFSLFITNWSVLPGSQKISLLVQNLFPSPDFMAEKYGVKNRGFLPFWYLWRIAAGLLKLFRPVREKR